MFKMSDGVPQKVLKKIFPEKIERGLASDRAYSRLKRMILSGKLKKGKRLLRWKFVKMFDVNESTVTMAFSRLRKDGLITTKGKKGSFVR
ncbi:MAG TPA: GntR family transcriptional regulator [Thermodesulfobacteriota bacterium]|nr:GntR family transcriptional regulator [Thermodesulfobacteriota bacterium]